MYQGNVETFKKVLREFETKEEFEAVQGYQIILYGCC